MTEKNNLRKNRLVAPALATKIASNRKNPNRMANGTNQHALLGQGRNLGGVSAINPTTEQ
jgi:hypothetical protein